MNKILILLTVILLTSCGKIYKPAELERHVIIYKSEATCSPEPFMPSEYYHIRTISLKDSLVHNGIYVHSFFSYKWQVGDTIK